MQSTDYRDGARGLLPPNMMYRSPNGNFPRPVLIAFAAATVIMILVSGNTSAAIPFYGIGVFAPIAFMGFSVTKHLRVTKPSGYKVASLGTFLVACLSVFIFVSQIVGKFEEGGWIRLVSFSSLFIIGHSILLSKGGERSSETARHLIHDISRIEGTMAELLTWQTQMMQTYRHNLLQRIAAWRRRQPQPIKDELLPYPPYEIH